MKLEAEIGKRNKQIGPDIISVPGETLEQFRKRVSIEIREYTYRSGAEHAASISIKVTVKPDGTSQISYAAVIQSAGSPVVSTDNIHMPAGDGWKLLPDEGMHSHGYLRTGYELTKLDILYLETVDSMRGAYSKGDRVGIGPQDKIRNDFIERGDFSGQDRKHSSLYLVTPTEVKHGYWKDGQWQSDTLK